MSDLFWAVAVLTLAVVLLGTAMLLHLSTNRRPTPGEPQDTLRAGEGHRADSLGAARSAVGTSSWTLGGDL